jgi:hypothetical protein
MQIEGALPGERRIVERDGSVLRYTTDRSSPERIDSADEDSDGKADVVEAALQGIENARHLLVAELDLSSPGAVEILLLRLGGSLDGLLLPGAGSGGRPLLVLEAAPRGGASASRRAAAHQYAHAVANASSPAMPPAWSEALAVWVGMRLEGGPDARAVALLSHRIENLASGLLSDDLEIAAGNALWFAFIEEAFGATTVQLTVRELGTGAPVVSALERALLRGSGETFRAAFREFHLWTVLVGERSDARHFPFARHLASPRFAAFAEELPVLSVHLDPAVGPLGATTLRLRSGENDGGLTLRFEGEQPAIWEVDLLMIQAGSTLRRMAVPLGQDGSGEVTVPQDGLEETLVLVRNLDGEDHGARHYTWSAHHEPGFPYELAALDASPAGEEGHGVVIRWETLSERGLVGFNVLRTEPDGGATSRVNPVWVPSLGDLSTGAVYQFLDSSAVPGVVYVYRIEGITKDGLSSLSDAISPFGNDTPR